MLREKKLLKIFWRFLRFIGLQPNTNLQTVALSVGVVSLAVILCSCIAEVWTTNNPNVIISGIQMVPIGLLIVVNAGNFFRKSKQIESWIKKMDENIAKLGGESLLEESFRQALKFVFGNGVFVVLSFLPNAILFILNGQSAIPMYFPSDNRAIRIVGAVFQAATVFVFAGSLWIQECLLLICLSAANGNLLGLRKKFAKIQSIYNDLEKCCIEYLELKK